MSRLGLPLFNIREQVSLADAMYYICSQSPCLQVSHCITGRFPYHYITSGGTTRFVDITVEKLYPYGLFDNQYDCLS
jgi:hypothetical protein